MFLRFMEILFFHSTFDLLFHLYLTPDILTAIVQLFTGPEQNFFYPPNIEYITLPGSIVFYLVDVCKTIRFLIWQKPLPPKSYKIFFFSLLIVVPEHISRSSETFL